MSDLVRPLERPDPVGAVLDAHREGRLLALGTSGTGGASRAVVRTTASWFDSFPVVAGLTDLGSTARVWVPGPLAGTMNLFAAALAAATGARLVGGPEDATHAHLTPTLLRRLLADGTDLAGRTLTVAGDRLDPATAEVAARAGARVTHYYGAAELSFVAWGTHEDDLHPFPGVEVEVRDEVVWARSAYLARVPTVDGFATVGDRGRLEGGVLRVHGRGDAAVVTSGATVLVEDVEAALRPVLTGEVAVLGVDHVDLGQVVTAVLTRREDLAPARSAAAGLPGTHRPRRWYAVPDLPRGAAGKLDRAALRRLVTDLRPLAAGTP